MTIWKKFVVLNVGGGVLPTDVRGEVGICAVVVAVGDETVIDEGITAVVRMIEVDGRGASVDDTFTYSVDVDDDDVVVAVVVVDEVISSLAIASSSGSKSANRKSA